MFKEYGTLLTAVAMAGSLFYGYGSLNQKLDTIHLNQNTYLVKQNLLDSRVDQGDIRVSLLEHKVSHLQKQLEDIKETYK